MQKVLFLCTGNSCRSIMAEGILNSIGMGRFEAFSAGSLPSGRVHPMSIETLEKNGISTKGCHSKSWDNFKDNHFDIVITVCDNAANEVCPIFSGAPKKIHWSIPDPAGFKGSKEETAAEFQRIFNLLKKKIESLL